KRRVRLLRCGGVHAGEHAAALRAALEGRGLHLGDLVAATLADQLVDGWHVPAFCVASLSSSLCTAVMSCSRTPRPGVSHASAAKIFSRLRGHANRPGVQACLRNFRGQVRNAPYLPGTIVHNTRADAALQTRPRGPN